MEPEGEIKVGGKARRRARGGVLRRRARRERVMDRVKSRLWESTGKGGGSGERIV